MNRQPEGPEAEKTAARSGKPGRSVVSENPAGLLFRKKKRVGVGYESVQREFLWEKKRRSLSVNEPKTEKATEARVERRED